MKSFGSIVAALPQYRHAVSAVGRFLLVRPAVRAFLRDCDAIVPLHSKRSPRFDELRQLSRTGLDLLAQAKRPGARRRLHTPLLRISFALGEHATSLTLLDEALAQRSRLNDQELKVLIRTTNALLAPARAAKAPELVERLRGIHRAALAATSPLSPGARQILAATIGKLSDPVAAARETDMARRTPADWTVLASHLLERCDTEDGPGPVQDAIGTVDAALPALAGTAAERVDARLLLWLSVIVAAKITYLVERDRSAEAIIHALDRAPGVGRIALDPLGLFDKLIADTADPYAVVWEAMSVEPLWHLVFPAGADLRRKVLAMAIDGAATGAYRRRDPNAVGLAIYRRLHQSEDLWLGAESRRDLLERYVTVIDLVNEPMRTVIRGLCRLAEDDEDAAEALFAQRRGPAFNGVFNGYGHISFVTTKEIAACLDRPVDHPSFSPGACGFRVEKAIPHDPRHLVAVACADPKYVQRYFQRYLGSLAERDRTTGLHLHLLGRPEEFDPDVRKAIARHDRISMTSEEPPVRMPYYYATARFLRTPLFQDLIPSALMLTDMDVRFIGSPELFFRQWRDAGDVGLRLFDSIRPYQRVGMTGYKAPRMESWGCVNASCVFLNATEPARRFGRDLASVAQHALARVADNGNSNWWIDQTVLYSMLRPTLARNDGLRLFNLFDLGGPFGAYAAVPDGKIVLHGHRPGMPDVPPIGLARISGR